MRFYTFNVADSAVTVGALLLAWSLSQEEHDERLAHTASRRSEMAGPEA
jgi:lipoprotein signal peptidase